VCDAGNNELLGDFVGEVVVRGENDRSVLVVPFQEIIECVEFLLSAVRAIFRLVASQLELDVLQGRTTCV